MEEQHTKNERAGQMRDRRRHEERMAQEERHIFHRDETLAEQKNAIAQAALKRDAARRQREQEEERKVVMQQQAARKWAREQREVDK